MQEIYDEIDDEGNVIDPNEARYCLCNRVSFGVMIGCENENVSFSPPFFQSEPRRKERKEANVEFAIVRERMVPYRLCGIEGCPG